MKALKILLFILLGLFINETQVEACSVIYYVDPATGKVYAVNNEDYWYDVKAYVKIEPKTKSKRARLWYGWDKFAQGGINSEGLFFDAAVTPEQPKVIGFGNPSSNLGDEILAYCATVNEALDYLEKRKIGLTNSHMMFGDKSGKAVIVEWINGERILHWIANNRLIMTNFLISDTTAGNYPCYRYESIDRKIKELENGSEEVNFLRIGNAIAQAVQSPKADENGRIGGTVYTSFINISDMEFILSFKLSNENLVKLDVKKEFEKNKGQKNKLE